MKEILYTIILFFISFPCYSKWEKVHENKIFTEYFEVDAVKKIDDIVFISEIKEKNQASSNACHTIHNEQGVIGNSRQ